MERGWTDASIQPREREERIVIGEIELGQMCVRIVSWAWGGPNREIIFIRTDNRNVFDWASIGNHVLYVPEH